MTLENSGFAEGRRKANIHAYRLYRYVLILVGLPKLFHISEIRWIRGHAANTP